MVDDRRFTVALWVPLFTAVMVCAALEGFPDLWLFAVAMGLATWGVCDAAALLWHHLRAWQGARRRADRRD